MLMLPRFFVFGHALLLLLVLSACAGAPPLAREGGGTREPRIAPTDLPEYTCVEGCTQPEWVNTIPDDANNSHYFVGLSGYHASEQAGREEALNNARKEYAAYTGVEITSLDEVVRASYGLSSGVVDGALSGRSYEKQSSDASISRFKGQKYHPQRFKVSRYGEPAGSAYQYCVLAAVPIDEIERVRQWKKEKEALVTSARADDHRHFQQSLESFEAALAAGKALNALTYWRSAAELSASPLEKGAIKAAWQRWGDAVTLDVGRFTTLALPGEGRTFLLPVWVTAQGRAQAQFPLRLLSPQGEVVAHAMTGIDGRGDLLVPPGMKGALRIELDPDFELPPVAAQVQVVEANDFLSLLQSATMILFGGPQSQPLPVTSVSFGSVTCQRGPAAGEFALAVKGGLRQSLTAIPGLRLRDPQPRSVVALNQAMTRGIAVSGKAELSAGSSTIQAGLDNADAALEIDYQLQGKDVVLSLSLVRAYNDEVLRTAVVTIPVRTLPPGLALRPAANNELPATAPGAIHLDITSHLGAGQVYREGELIRYFLSSDRDCQLLLLYQDAGGQLLQIFPNAHSRDSRVGHGSFVEFPGKNDPFEFAVAPPFGTERVFAFAALQPFPLLDGQDEGGLRLLSGSLESLQQTLRDFGRSSGGEYGEAAAVVVTARKE